MMEILPKILFRLILPLALLTGCIFRYSLLSAVYLLFLLIIPLLPSPSARGSKSSLHLQWVIFTFSIVFIISQVIFQIVLVSYPPYGHFVRPCSTASNISIQVGFYLFEDCAVKDIIRLLAPDVVVLACSLIGVLFSRHLSIPTSSSQNDIDTSHSSLIVPASVSFIEKLLPYIEVLFLWLAGIIAPNMLSSVYFITFIIIGIVWAFHLSKHIGSGAIFSILNVFLTIYAGLHVFVLYLYQFPFFQNYVDATNLIPRLLGLTGIIETTHCSRNLKLVFNNNLRWPFYVYPFIIFVLYWILAVSNRQRYKKYCNGMLSGQKPSPWWMLNSVRKTVKKETSPLIDSDGAQQYGSLTIAQQPKMDHEKDGEAVQIQGTFWSIMTFLMRQSYIAALIIMMTWSILYHSWVTFVLLLWACLTWITPFARWFCMNSSPYLVIYADLLLIVQYIYGLNLRDDEMPIKEGAFNFSELGLIHYTYPVLHLGAQTIFSLVFLVTLRQHYHEKISQKKHNSDDMVLTTIMNVIKRTVSSARSDVGNVDVLDNAKTSDDARAFMTMLKSILAKYWILVCCGAFLLVALQNSVSLYQVFYMVIFLVGFIIYQFSLRTWKTILRPLWWFMVVYSILMLLTIYIYQFENMPQYLSNATHLSEKWLHDIGLRQQSKASLLVELLIPTTFSIVLVIQLHFFHRPLMLKISGLLRFRRCKTKVDTSNDSHQNKSAVRTSTDLSSVTMSTAATSTYINSASDDDIDDDNSKSTLRNLKKHYDNFTVILWRIAEIHSSKIVSFVVIMVVLQQVSAINAVFMLLLVMSMPSTLVHRFINYILIVWSSIVVLVIMLYQLQFVKENSINSNCTAKLNKTTPQALNGSHFFSNAWWLGFHKSDEVSVDVRGYLFIVLFIVFEKVVRHHQELYCFQKNTTTPPSGILFKDTPRKMADENIVNCVKYLCNHFFSLFGVEINLMVMILSMCIRGDAVSVIHSLWLFIFLLVKRKNAARLWTFYVAYLSIMLLVQYVLILGWPPGLCKGYPWDDFKPDNLVQWLYLTDVEKPQDQNLLLADFFQLLVACCQANVFRMEANHKTTPMNQISNNEQYLPPDFMSNKTWLDFIKILILDQFIWVSLTIVYITAQQTTSLFNSGFMVGCFFFLWHGQGLYLRKRRTMKRWWKTFIMYNFFVVVAKCWLQLVSCVFISSIYSETHCYLIQLLNLYCLRSEVYDTPITTDDDCIAQYDTGLMMDSVCFIVALIQYRILESIYFKYVIREHRRQSMIAYRGAQLVEECLQIRLNESIQRDKRKMQIIKTKVLKLKQRLAQLNPEAQEPLSHYEAIYAGDYYLFEDSETDSDTDITCEDTEDLTISTTPMQTSEFQAEDEGHHEEEHLSMVNEDDQDTEQMKENKEQADGVLCNILRKRRKSKTDSVHNVEVISPSPEASTESVIEEDGDTESSKTCKEKAQELFTAMKTFFQDLASSATKYLNETSSDYRYITSQLALEKKDRARALSQTTYAIEEQTSKMQKLENYPESIMSTSIITKEDDSDTWSDDDHEHEKVSWKKSESYSVQLAVAFYYALLAHTDLLCYTLMIINHMYYACVLSMPLPFFVFLWGMLSIPRPTKRFWVTVITYVELVIVVKYIFQFQLPEDKQLNFNECSYYDAKEAKSPLCPPRIIGIERNRYSSAWDLVLLLSLFFHRFALKAHGLWREKSFSDEEDTAMHNVASNNDSGDAQTQPKAMVNIESPQDSVGTVLTTSRSTHRKSTSIFHNVKHFIQRMLDPEVGTGAVDVYAWMFGAQFIVFIIILSSWSAFSSTQESMSNFAKIIEENNVPKTFLYMLLTQFLLILLDRFLYMRKHVFAKLLHLVILVFLFHIFLFVIVPEITQKPFIHNIPAIFMYLFQCIYFGLSAYQVRCGYPTRILGNFLTKNYTVTSGVLFQGIQSIPFLLELRSVLDWVCTKTTLSLSHWLKMEDIYANVFVMKCWRDSEKTWPHSRGMAYWQSSKLVVGGILLTLLILVIWFPLLLMSFINSAYISNRPVQATFTLTVGGYQPLFKVSTQQQYIKELSSHEINSLINKIKERYKGETGPSWDSNKMEQELQDYRKTGTIVRIKVLSNSSAIWTISPPSRDFLINDLESNSSISLRFKYVFDREPNSTLRTIVQESVTGVTTIPLAAGDTIRRDLAKVLRSPSGDGEIEIKHLFPTFIQIPGSGPVYPVKWIAGGGYIKTKLILRRGYTSNFNATQVEWWDIVQDDPKLASRKPGYLEIIALNDLVPPLHLSFFANKGIIGLYVGFVWLVGKFVRLFFTSISYRIMFDELPNVNRVLKLCLEIYMVRESKELKLEEDLFAKLLFLYRSPETLIKWTKYKRLKVD